MSGSSEHADHGCVLALPLLYPWDRPSPPWVGEVEADPARPALSDTRGELHTAGVVRHVSLYVNAHVYISRHVPCTRHVTPHAINVNPVICVTSLNTHVTSAALRAVHETRHHALRIQREPSSLRHVCPLVNAYNDATRLEAVEHTRDTTRPTRPT